MCYIPKKMVSSCSLSAGSLFILGLVPSAFAAPDYKLFETWQGKNFLDYFNFHVGSDPTNGFVTYLDRKPAEDAGLVKHTDSGSIYLGVDHKTKLSSSGPGRDSVRIGTKKYYGESLIIADIAHMPGSVCGTWPAFWSTGRNWPGDGEIDIIEGVNLQDHNEIVMHTGGTCSIKDEGMTGVVNATGCGEDLGTVGCVIEGQKGSYGTSFNKHGGGVYALEWTAKYLKIWFFPRHSIPASISKGKPNVTEFGMPMALVEEGCDVANSFKAQSFVFDVTFCGDWAGGVFSESGCPLSSPDSFQSCTDYVAHNPAAFKETYWEINHVKVYQTGLKGIDSSTASQTTSSEVLVAEATTTRAPETTTVVGTSPSHASASEDTATSDASTHATQSVASQTSVSHGFASETSATSVFVESPAGWHVIGPATNIQGVSPAGVIAPTAGKISQSPKMGPTNAFTATPEAATTSSSGAAAPSGSFPTTTERKPATTRYVTKLVTSTTTLCSFGESFAPSAHAPHAAERPATADAVAKPAISEAPAATQSVNAAVTTIQQQSMTQVKEVVASSPQLTAAASHNEPNTESSVDAASNGHTELTAARTRPTVIPGPNHTSDSASMLPPGNSLQTSIPVIPTPTQSSAASSGALASPSGTRTGASHIFTGAADKLSVGFSAIAVAFGFAMTV